MMSVYHGMKTRKNRDRRRVSFSSVRVKKNELFWANLTYFHIIFVKKISTSKCLRQYTCTTNIVYSLASDS